MLEITIYLPIWLSDKLFFCHYTATPFTTTTYFTSCLFPLTQMTHSPLYLVCNNHSVETREAICWAIQMPKCVSLSVQMHFSVIAGCIKVKCTTAHTKEEPAQSPGKHVGIVRFCKLGKRCMLTFYGMKNVGIVHVGKRLSIPV